MQKPYSHIATSANASAPLANNGITTLADAHARLAAYMRQMRVEQLMEQMRQQKRLRQAMEAWRGLVRGSHNPAPAAATLPRALNQAAIWLRTHPHHPDALAVAMHLERIAPGWRQGQTISRNAGQGGA